MAALATPPPPPAHSLPDPSTSSDAAPTSTATYSSQPEIAQHQPRTPTKRPSMNERQSSTTMIVPSNHPEIEQVTPREFPPDDARAMSPRQSNENIQVMCGESRSKIESSTMEHQSSLAALVEKIETVKSGHEKLERDNNALQEYIGGLTKSMSKTDLAKGGRK